MIYKVNQIWQKIIIDLAIVLIEPLKKIIVDFFNHLPGILSLEDPRDFYFSHILFINIELNRKDIFF